jgi:hypothetical protein
MLIITTALLAAQAYAQQAPPATDVYLATMQLRDGHLTVSAVENVTQHPGYDNQPAFVDDGRVLLFTSVREGGQSDIYRLDVSRHATTPFTRTPESEYSATLTPDGRSISVIRVERDSAQRLWRFPLGGGAPSLVLDGIKPVGYHAWGDDHQIALFVLGSPNTLQLADTRTGKSDTITTRVGRSLHRLPKQHVISFVDKSKEGEWWLKTLDLDSRAVTPLVQMPQGTEDYVWLPDGSAVAGKGSTLVRWRAGKSAWEQVVDLSTSGISSITRLAVSPKGDRLAFVAAEPVRGTSKR